ncbi:single-stranded DNA-binding protein, partial [Salmonella enterica]|uniref:single-stranded DNA-binding protein n=1 Tax=Salmonella enterica TaxID=28901 RepID=UPI001BAFE0CC
GNIGHDLDLRYTGGGKAVLNFNIAVRAGRDNTDWFRLVVWDKQAEMVNKYCGKGSKIGISGRLSTNEFQDKEGNNRKNVEITAFNVEFLDSKGSSQGDTSQDNQQQANDPFESNNNFVEIQDDDLPF